jgi:RNA polymerase sigma-70 factor (ECF subfamily)
LRSIAEGDSAALGELYDRYVVDLWRAVSQTLAEPSATEEVVHAVFLNLPRMAASYEGGANCCPWLTGLAVRFATHHHREGSRLRRILSSLAKIVTPRAIPSARDQGELATFERALACLTVESRAAFVLADLQALTCEEIAKALEIPAATVRTRLLHARRDLRAAMKRAESS